MLIIGVGNPFRRDDGAGMAVASEVKAHAGGNVRVLIRTGEGADLIECWKPDDDVIIVDAMKSGGEPGAVLRIDAKAGPFPVENFRISSHSFGVAEAVEVARALQRLPRSLIVYGIEAVDLGEGEGLTPEVAKAVGLAATRVMADIEGRGKT